MPRTDFPVETARRILLDWCAAQGMTAVRIRDAGALLPDLAPSLVRPRKGPFDWRDGWLVLGTAADSGAADLPLLPGAPLQTAPPRIVAAGPWIDELLLNLAFRLTGEADRHDLREGWRVPRFPGRPWMAGNGHPCKACRGTGKGRSLVQVVHGAATWAAPSWCPGCDGWGLAPGAGFPGGTAAQPSWRGQTAGWARADTRTDFLLRLLAQSAPTRAGAPETTTSS